MSDTTHNSAARRGASYLSVIGVLGILLTMYLVIEGISQVWIGRFLAGFGLLVVGAFLGAAAIHVLSLWREARGAGKRSSGQ
jgi:hypothetical protein